MYRTEDILNHVKTTGGKLNTPICIPSYGRPDAPIFTKGSLNEMSKDEVFVFIRKEQQELYQVLEDRFTLVVLPSSVHCIGTTRQAIVEWAHDRGYINIFMFDDRITKIDFLCPKTSKSNSVSLCASPNSTVYNALLVWEEILNKFPVTLSCPSHKGFSYFSENIDINYEVNNGICAACVNVNVKDLFDYGIKYKPLDECGGEDLVIMLDIMQAGLPTSKITDLEYDEVPSNLIHSGGNHTDGNTQVDRSELRNKILWEKTLGIPYGTKHPYVYLRKSGDVTYPYIRWAYWKDFYAKNKVKDVDFLKNYHQPSCQPTTSSKDLYHIPGDKGGNWRFDKMIKYISNFPDEIGPIVNSYLKDKSDDYKTWWVFLYSTCYCMGSAMLMCEKLDYKIITDKDIDEFWVDNKEKLIFQSDRRYIKNINQFPIIVKEFINRSNRKPYEYISRYLCSDPKDTYNSLYKEVSTWKYYGRFSVILFIYNLSKVFPSIELQPTNYDWKNGATTTSAIFNVIYEDKLASDWDAGKGFNLDSDDINTLDDYLNLIIDGLKKANPNKVWNIINVSSDLCSYRKLFKGVRYQGYYVDRQQEEIMTLEKNNPDYQWLWDFIWNARKENINNVLLGELNGWNGIRKEREKLFLEHGYIGTDICPEF